MRAAFFRRPMNRIVLLLAALLGVFAFPGFAVAEDAVAGAPEGYPREIQLEEVEGILKPLKIAGQGCGSCGWEGKSWGFFGNHYHGKVETPWQKKPVSLRAHFAYSKEGSFLIGLVIDHQEYHREKRSDDVLVWKRDLRTAK